MVGTVVDNYRLQEVLGTGGMGVVYKAVDTSLDKVVALKVMNPRLLGDDRFLRRFKAEARALGRLPHPHIVNVFAFRNAAPFLLIVTEYVKGGTLTDLIRRRGPLSWQAAVPLMRQTLEAIAYAHRQNIIHRDIKPGNILLTCSGAVKVTDFGLAKIPAHPAGSLGGTSAEFAAGTLCYMPPEQLDGLANVDQRGDIYALGMTFYEMLAGRTPFAPSASGFAVQKAIAAHDFPSLDQLNDDVPAPLVRIVTKAIEHAPEDRFPSADAMRAALDAWVEQTAFHEAGGPGPAAHVGHVALPLKTAPRPAVTKTQHLAASRTKRNRRSREVPRRSGVVAFLVGVSLLVSLLFTQDGWYPEPPVGEVVSPSGGMASQRQPQLLEQGAVPSTPTVSEPQEAEEQRPAPGTPLPEPAEEASPKVIVAALAAAAIERPPAPGEALRQPLVGSDSLKGIPARPPSAAEQDTPAQGVLRVKPSPWGNVYVDGAPQAYEIDYWYTLSLPAQRHRITVRNPVLDRSWTSEVDLAPGDTQDVVIDFMARVTVNVAAKDTDGQPVSGEIYVDGNPTGDWVPRKIEVYPGRHHIEVRAAGYTQLEVREAGGEVSLPLDNPGPFNQSPRTRIIHAILQKIDGG